jgi:hypothetical protein
MEDELAATAGGIQIFLRALKANAQLLKRIHGFDQMLQTPAEPVELPDDEGIAFS